MTKGVHAWISGTVRGNEQVLKLTVSGDPGGNRTRDNLIKSQVLELYDFYDYSNRCEPPIVPLQKFYPQSNPLLFIRGALNCSTAILTLLTCPILLLTLTAEE